jgi:hypothetical protein
MLDDDVTGINKMIKVFILANSTWSGFCHTFRALKLKDLPSG